jgi:anti-repressor protein
MNIQLIKDGQLVKTMSSLEIAKLTGKNHSDVLRDIREQLFTGLYGHKFDKANLLYPLIQGLAAIVDSHTKRTKEIALDRYHTDILISGYEVKYRAAIVKRWQELEAQQTAFKLPATFSEALRMLADESEAKERALAKIESDRPKVEFAEKVRALDGSISIGDFAKVIGTGQNRLFKKLRDDGFLMNNNHPMQHSLERGLLVQIEQTPYTDSKGKSHPAFQTRITGKGQVFFEKRYRTKAVLVTT